MDIVVTFLLICGLIFFTGGAVGIIRFPDFYSRLHPAGKLDTMGLLFTMIALASPTAVHGIVDAGVSAGLTPWTKGEKRR